MFALGLYLIQMQNLIYQKCIAEEIYEIPYYHYITLHGSRCMHLLLFVQSLFLFCVSAMTLCGSTVQFDLCALIPTSFFIL